METTSSLQPPAQNDYSTPQNGPFILRNLISDVPLSADGEASDVHITCVEVYADQSAAENLYIGTSAAEILHFVLIPAEPDDPTGQPTPILASRLQPTYTHESSAGVQQILLLPTVNKACIVCNNTLTFYSLPELSPAFPNVKPLNCSHVGGIDEDVEEDAQNSNGGVTVLMAQKNKVRLIKVSEEGAKTDTTFEYGGCLIAKRRGDIACVADLHSYALLDVVLKQKVPLFPISSLDEEASRSAAGPTQDISTNQGHTPSKSVSSTSASLTPREGRTHGRSTSLGIFGDQRRLESPRPGSQARYGFDAPELFSRSRSPWPANSPDKSPERSSSQGPSKDNADKPLPPPPAEPQPEPTAPPKPAKTFEALTPYIVSPTPNEFLLTTGTTLTDPGVGSFVNLDGDPSRGTMEFSSYPSSIIVDGQGLDPSSSMGPGQTPEEGYVLATVIRGSDDEKKTAVEIQRWDIDPGESTTRREWIEIPGAETGTSISPAGMRTVVSKITFSLQEIGWKLTQKRIDLRGLTSDKAVPVRSSSLRPDDQGAADYAKHLSTWQARNVLWSKGQIWWVVRNPMVLKFDAQLEYSILPTAESSKLSPDRDPIERVLNDVRDLQGYTEVDFLGLGYIRQKASILLFMDLIIRTLASVIVFEKDKRATEEALVQGEVDPRIILSLLPLFRDEVVQAPNGISIPGGLKSTIETFFQHYDVSQIPLDPKGPFGDNLLQLIRRYLFLWRKKKGMASIPDNKEVSQTVDAALLHVLLLLDREMAQGPTSASSSIRSELNSVVDGGVDCFDRAVTLLEQFNRLYVLGRLYQNRKLFSKVLETWRRILEGEPDVGGEFVDGEQEMRKYLGKLRDPTLVEEYGTWLANRNPKIGVQLFADDSARVKFEPAHAVQILKSKAPGAVKEYLEYLVFGKKLSQYSNDLIGFYLDAVIDELSSSKEMQSILLRTYETYRALRAPKPTYQQFITDNALAAPWWNNRLRLLQLLGSNTGSEAAQYDVGGTLSRLKPYEQELVPEMIILAGRQGEHDSALRLLTHGLGDFDTAVNYCLLGGSSIFRSGSGFVPEESIPSREQQSRLFQVLLSEFLKLEDLRERLERTGELLERFGGWFDVLDVLNQVPDEWAVEIFSGFLVGAFRGLIRDRHESEVVKALSGAVNLRSSADLIEKLEAGKPVVDRVN